MGRESWVNVTGRGGSGWVFCCCSLAECCLDAVLRFDGGGFGGTAVLAKKDLRHDPLASIWEYWVYSVWLALGEVASSARWILNWSCNGFEFPIPRLEVLTVNSLLDMKDFDFCGWMMRSHSRLSIETLDNTIDHVKSILI